MDENEENESSALGSGEDMEMRTNGLAGASNMIVSSGLGLSPVDAAPNNNETQDMSVSTLHLYDIHLSQVCANTIIIRYLKNI